MMKTAVWMSLILVLVSSTSFAGSVPRCWRSDLPDLDIKDGVFRVFIPTDEHDASDVAGVLAGVSMSSTAQVAVGTDGALSRIEIDLINDVSSWQASVTFPTLDSYKNYVLDTISPALMISGVYIECAKNSPHFPAN